jgi:hypothetical protein
LAFIDGTLRPKAIGQNRANTAGDLRLDKRIFDNQGSAVVLEKLLIQNKAMGADLVL